MTQINTDGLLYITVLYIQYNLQIQSSCNFLERHVSLCVDVTVNNQFNVYPKDRHAAQWTNLFEARRQCPFNMQIQHNWKIAYWFLTKS